MIENHIDYGILLLFEFTSISDKWKIWKTETDGMLHGDTTMDNFDMLRFLLQVVKIDDDVVKYCGCYGDCD